MSSITPASGRHTDNVARGERWASLLAGSGLLVYGLRRRSLPRLGWLALGGALVERGMSGSCRVYRALGIDTSLPTEPLHITEAIQVLPPPEVVYAFWRDLQNLPRFMRHLQSVTPLPEGRSRWLAQFAAGPAISWEAEVVEDVPEEVLAWRSLPGADVENAGTVRFTALPGGRGTGLRIDLLYRAPAGRLGDTLARALTPLVRQQIREDVRRFKSLIETGEAPTTEGQPSGRAEPDAGARRAQGAEAGESGGAERRPGNGGGEEAWA